MKYMGSKNRIAKDILPIMLNNHKDCFIFYDLFCGGGNLIDKVPDTYIKIANDYDKDVISALTLIKENLELIPKNNREFTEQDYKNMKNDKDNILYGYVAHALSYGGKKWGGWRRDKVSKRDYVNEAYKNAVKQSYKLQNVRFLNKSYDNVKLRKKSIIYCDIPYKQTTKYKNKFDYDKFWKWVEEKTKQGFNIYVSEYQAPENFIPIWKKEIVSSLTKNTGEKKGVEKLFIHKDLYNKLYVTE